MLDIIIGVIVWMSKAIFACVVTVGVLSAFAIPWVAAIEVGLTAGNVIACVVCDALMFILFAGLFLEG